MRENFQANVTCSNSTKEAADKRVKYIQSEQKGHQNDVIDIVLVSLLLTLNINHTLVLL